MTSWLRTDIKFLPGVGPKRASLLNEELNIRTFEDLLYHFPYRYIDRSRIYTIAEIHSQLPYIQVRGRIASIEVVGPKYKKRLVARLVDSTGSIEMVWFRGVSWIRETLKQDREYIVYGKPNIHGRKISLVHPEMEDAARHEQQLGSGLQALYRSTEKLKKNYISSKSIQKLITALWQTKHRNIPETLPGYLRTGLRLPDLEQSIFQVHFPSDTRSLEKATARLKFEELFYIQLNILKQKVNRKVSGEGLVFGRVGNYLNEFYEKCLPFELTGAQKRVIREIRKDIGSGRQMNRLLQGDVGSGKTLVALMNMLISLDNGYQACLMAPTEILASQHFSTIRRMLGDLPVNIELLTGSTRKPARERIDQGLGDGSLQMLIGTHALIEERVQFNNLGLAVIDEQHRFGVAQRAKIWAKNTPPPHVLVMTATPIPRTLAMTLYGDLDVSVIDELPPGRKPVRTVHYTDVKRLRVHGFMKKQIAEGRQIYIVYPLIRESEKMDYKDLEDGYFSIKQAFPSPAYAVSMVHGRLKPEEKDFEMKRFQEHKTHIMVATTVIEVGVDIPNATVMIIESAERFGLSQLHQLRGRVGRGADQSYCVLMTSNQLSEDARKRIRTMVDTTDGFEIAEADLKLRGPGDLEGTQQSGIPFDLKIADLGKDSRILQFAREKALEILEEDPALELPGHRVLVNQLKRLSEGRFDWSKIG